MRFTITQDFDSSASDVIAAYADASLYPALIGLPKLGDIEPLDHHVEGSRVRQRIRFRFTGHLPPAVTAVVDPAKLSWIQESEHDLDDGTTSFELLPDHYRDRLRASGSFEIESSETGSLRRVDGQVRVRAPLVAGRVEAAIVSGLEEYLAAEAPRVDTWIAGTL